MNEGKIITITSRKGGVGKTTTLLNLAGIYSNLEKKVLIIDLDLYSSSISVSLNLKKDKTIYNMVLDITNNKLIGTLLGLLQENSPSKKLMEIGQNAIQG